MVKLLDIVQVCMTTQRYHLPEWARAAVTKLGGPGFVIHGQQFHWYDYIVRTEFYGVKGMRREDVSIMAHNGNLINSIERSDP